MKLEILGNSGSAGKGCYTSCAVINDCIALDAGTGLHTLPVERMLKIKDVIVTHPHMDHVALLCFLTDHHAVNGSALTIHSLPQTLNALSNFLFNGELWPRMHKITGKRHRMLVSFKPLIPYQATRIRDIRLTPLRVEHGIPTLGFCLHGERENFVYCVDMIDAPPRTWQYLKQLKRFRHMSMEVSFPNEMEALARVSNHLTPVMLKNLAEKLPADVNILYNHNKMPYQALIRRQVRQSFGNRARPMKRGDIFHL